MDNQNKHFMEADWELSDEFYEQDADRKELSLEDFIDDDSAGLNQESGLSQTSTVTAELEQIAADVRRITALAAQGKAAAEIAQELSVGVNYVSDVMVCVQAFPEDDPLAVARLIALG